MDRPDDQTIQSAYKLLRESPVTRNLRIRVVVQNGELVLKGSVTSYHIKQLVQELLRPVLIAPLVLRNCLKVGNETNEQGSSNEPRPTETTGAVMKGSSKNNNDNKHYDRLLGEFQIDPARIKPNEDALDDKSIFKNARSTLKKEEMATQRESIRRIGLLKSPIVRPIKNDPDGYTHQIVCGSRRHRNIMWLRHQAEGVIREKRPFRQEELCYKPETSEWLPATEVYATLKCMVRDCDDETAIAINLAENLEHAKVPELDLMEFCQYLVDLKDEHGNPRFSREWVADRCNRSESWVSLTLELNQLPEKVKRLMNDDRVTRTAALQFLQTERDKIDEVIETGQEIVRQEKMNEAREAEAELKIANIDLSDAENDLEIHKMMQNDSLVSMAQKRIGTARKRVSAASEKRDVALKEADNPKLTADVINKANLLVPGAKKGAPKAMPVAAIKKFYTGFKEHRKSLELRNGEEMLYSTIESLLEVILGHRACDSVATLIAEERQKRATVTISSDAE